MLSNFTKLTTFMVYFCGYNLFGEPVVNFKQEYYQLKGVNLTDVCRVMKIKMSNYSAMTYWDYVVTFKVVSEKGGYKIDNVKVILNCSIKMPQWDRYHKASKITKSQWDKFYNALLQHELNHKAIAIQYAKEIEAQLLNTKGKSSVTLNFDGLNLIEKLKAIHTAAQTNYDNESNHGLNEGINFDL